MSVKKYQIFVSSTFRDLIDERQDAIRNILDLNHIPAGMELFPAADQDQLEYIKKVIDECDYYILILGGRYGSIDIEGISYTEREYDYAVETAKYVLAFVHSDLESIPFGKSEKHPELMEAMSAFRAKIRTGRLVREWTNRQQLESLLIKSLVHAFANNPQVGWIRGNALAKEELIEQNNSLLVENADLKRKIAEYKPALSFNSDDIADLGELFFVRYKYEWGSYRDRRTSTAVLKVSWLNLFLAVAAQLDVPRTDIFINFAIKEVAKQMSLGHVPSTIDETDRVRIKVQLIALGLIQSHVSETTKGGTAEFLSTTPRGRVLFMENMITRKSEE